MRKDLPPEERYRENNPESDPDDQSGLPPFVSSWGGFYRLVLFTFLGMVLLFYALQAAFR
jgi:hypothetical protein